MLRKSQGLHGLLLAAPTSGVGGTMSVGVTRRSIPVGVAVLMLLYSEASKGDETTIRESLGERLGHLTIESIRPSAMDGLFEVQLVEEGAIIYVDAVASIVITGDMHSFGEDGRLVNLTELRRAVNRRESLSLLDPDQTIVFEPEGQKRATVYVFTDVDCAYCRQFHEGVPSLNEAGVEVRYLAYPQSGLHSKSYRRMKTAWCSDDRNSALALLKRGLPIPEAACTDDPVVDHYELGRRFGLEGTPTIIYEDGHVSGYLPAAAMVEKLGIAY